MSVSALAAICLVGAAMLLAPPLPRQRLARLAQVESITAHSPRLRRFANPAVIGLAGLSGLVISGTAGLAVALSLALMTVTVIQLWRRHRRGRRAAALSLDVVDACQLLAGLLRVGHVPVMALRLAAVDCSVFAEAAAAQRVGAPVSPVFRRQSLSPGGSGLGDLAVAWEVSEKTGASLTTTLDALAQRLEAASRVARVVDAELSAPRATGRMLAALPIVGLGLGYVIGGDPAAFLLGSIFGQLCLVTAVVLACTGVWWIERLSGSVGD
jgi:tight adherence protein B